MPDVQRCLVAFSARSKEEEANARDEVGTAFQLVSKNADHNLVLCCCEASELLPRLKVRTALVKDYDDLQPVLESSRALGGIA